MKKEHNLRKSRERLKTKSSTPETSRFRVVNQEDQFKWELSDTMTEYANDHLSIFIQKKDFEGVNSKDHSRPIKLPRSNTDG